MLEVFNNLFMSIAEQMGVTLEKTSSSVNIKERLDFSCAVFNAGKAGRQRTAHAGASGLDGQVGGSDHRQQPGDAPRRCVMP
jgi:5-oxoprolinase (ATP-hydrolysing)